MSTHEHRKTPLTREAEILMVQIAQKGGDDGERAWVDLYNRHAGFTAHLTRKYAGQYSSCSHYADDLRSEGVRAFAMAIQQFDPGRGVRLVTLLRLLIRRLVLDYLARETRLHHEGRPPLSLDRSYKTVGLGAESESASCEEAKDTLGDNSMLCSVPPAPVLDEVPAMRAAMRRLTRRLRQLVHRRYIKSWRLVDLQESYRRARPATRNRVLRDLSFALQQLRRRM